MTTQEVDLIKSYAQARVAEAPPLTARQRDRLALIVRRPAETGCQRAA